MTTIDQYRLPFDIHDHLCLNALLRYIDGVVREVPPYFRQKDAEGYFFHPACCKYEVKRAIERELLYFHKCRFFQPGYFDRSECPFYTNDELRKLVYMSDREWQEAIDFAQFQLYLARRFS